MCLEEDDKQDDDDPDKGKDGDQASVHRRTIPNERRS